MAAQQLSMDGLIDIKGMKQVTFIFKYTIFMLLNQEDLCVTMVNTTFMTLWRGKESSPFIEYLDSKAKSGQINICF